jgi:hypothetical protein
MTSLPSYVTAAPSGDIPEPPVGTRAQLLPLSELGWPDFERLCLRLIEAQGEIIEARLYGDPGEKQEGIDFFARRTDGTLAVYQCRRVKAMTPAAIAKAVNDFLSGDWADEAIAFGICTSTNLSSRARAQAVEKGRMELSKAGKELETWDVNRLSLKLKDDPRLVDDFFDRPWVIRFNGQSAADQLQGRLGRRSAFRTRQDLHSFYSRVFKVHDAGLSLHAIAPPEDLRELFVVPGFEETVLSPTEITADHRAESAHDSASLEGSQDRTRTRGRASARVRIPADRWLSGRRTAIVTGEPGVGKSACLRFVALDLLSSAPRCPVLAHAWGSAIPLWVPFGRWTELIQDGGDRSLRGLLTTWLTEHGQPELVELYEDALNDGRAVLLVDGLDEWKTEASARIALNQLQVEAANADARVIATARPVALSRIGAAPGGWQTAQIAPLDRAQQLELLTRLTDWRIATEGTGLDPRGQVSAEDLVEELQGAPDLRELAEIPLTLVFLHWIRVRDTRLPRDRFRAYSALVNLLLERYPATRSAAAGVLRDRPDIGEDEVRGALGAVAFAIHEAGAGALSTSMAQQLVRDYLRDEEHGPGLDAGDAGTLARAVVVDARDRLGVLFDAGGNRLAFLHRSVQEHLCAAHLARRPLKEQHAVIGTAGTDPRWAEVILNLIHLTSRPTDADELVETLRQARRTRFPEGDPMLAEIASGGFGCSARLARALLLEAANAIETHARPALARAIVSRLVDGLENSSVSPLVRARVASWLPARGWSLERLYYAMQAWPDEEETDAVLWRAIFAEEARDARAAALVFAERARQAKRGPGPLAALLDRPLVPVTRAAVIEALGTHWPNNERLMAELPAARDSLDPDLRLVWLVLTVRARRHSLADLEGALQLAEWDSGVDYARRDQLAWALANGWARNAHLKEVCLTAASDAARPREFDQDVMHYVLFTAFPGDPDVVTHCVREIGRDHPFLGLHGAGGAWRLLAENFSDEPELVAAADEWLTNDRFHEPEVSFAALIGQTDRGKQRLLKDVQHGSFPHWAARALLQGWGLEDADVRSTLEGVALGPSAQAAAIGHLLPKILGRGDRCGNRVIELLQEATHRIDLLVEAILELGNPQFRAQALELVLQRPAGRPPLIDEDSAVIALAPDDPRVRQWALKSIDRRDPNLANLGNVYRDDADFRAVLRGVAAPLRASSRLRCAERLHELRVDDDDLRELVAGFPSEQNELVATTLARVFAIGARATAAEEGAVELAASELRTGSPKWECHAQAAVAVLLDLGRLDILKDAKFVGSDEPRPFSVPLTDYFRSNVTLASLIVDHWEQVSDVLGPEFPERFVGITGSADTFWEVISTVADRRSETTSAVLRYLSSREGPLSPSLLRFLSQVAPGSRQLRDACVNALTPGDAPLLTGESRIFVACEILASQFARDGELGSHLLAEFKSDHRPEYFLAIAQAWPGEQFAHALEEARRVRLEMSLQFLWRARIAAAAPQVAAQATRELLDTGARRPRAIESPAALIVKRLREDLAVADEYQAILLSDSASPTETASLGRLIALSTGLGDDVRTHLTEALVGPAGVHIAYDVIAGERRPVAHAAADALDQVAV